MAAYPRLWLEVTSGGAVFDADLTWEVVSGRPSGEALACCDLYTLSSEGLYVFPGLMKPLIRLVTVIKLAFAGGLTAQQGNNPATAHITPNNPPNRSIAPPTVSGTRAGITVFVNVNVVPMDRERVQQNQTVVVKGERITAMGPAEKVRVPVAAVRVDGRKKFLIPGLADMHAHFMLSPYSKMLATTASLSDRLALKERQLFLWLAHGLTTVRILDYGSHFVGGEDVLQLRARVAAGELPSPRIYTSGNLLGGLARPDTTSRELQLNEVPDVVRAYKAAGYDFIKIRSLPIAQPGVFDSLAAAARRIGLPLVGHTAAPLKRVLETYRSIEHLSGYVRSPGSFAAPMLNAQMPADSLAVRIQELVLATQGADVWNVPTLYLFASRWDGDHSPHELVLKRRLVKALQEAGAGLLAGSDVLSFPRPWARLRSAGLTRERERLEVMYGESDGTHRELQELVNAGLTPYQALATGTRNVAAYFGTLDSAGTIAVGKRADLVLLDGNPLADIRQTERIGGVMLGGRWLDRRTLDRRIADIGAWSTRWCASTAARQGGAGRSPCEDLGAP